MSSDGYASAMKAAARSEEHTSELQSQSNLVCRLLLEKKKKLTTSSIYFERPWGHPGRGVSILGNEFHQIGLAGMETQNLPLYQRPWCMPLMSTFSTARVLQTAAVRCSELVS